LIDEGGGWFFFFLSARALHLFFFSTLITSPLFPPLFFSPPHRYNAYRFFVQSTRRWEAAHPGAGPFTPDPGAAAASKNVLDRWLAAASADLARFVRAEMGAYRLYTVVPRLTAFIIDLTNVYVRYNRARLKGVGGGGEGKGAGPPPDDQLAALSALHATLASLALVMSPFTPFFSEALWVNLRRCVPAAWAWPESVHWADFPDPPEAAAGGGGEGGEAAVTAGVALMQAAIELARGVRDKHALPLRQPLATLTLIHADPAALAVLTPDLRAYIQAEANVGAVAESGDVGCWTSGRAVPDWAVLGSRLGPSMGRVAAGLKAADAALLASIEAGHAITVAGVDLGPADVSVVRTFVRPGGEGAPDGAGDPGTGLFIALDLAVDEALAEAGTAREVATRVQKARKSAGLVAGEAVEVWLGGGALHQAGAAPPLPPALAAALEAQAGWVAATLGGVPKALADLPAGRDELIREEHSLGAGDFVLVLSRPAA